MLILAKAPEKSLPEHGQRKRGGIIDDGHLLFCGKENVKLVTGRREKRRGYGS